MTLVLRDSLGGNCKTNMIATISTEEDDLDESISTCRFAGRVALIKNQVIRNEAVDPSIIIERLKRENKMLKAEIAMLKGSGEEKDHLESYEIDECKRQVDEFLNSKDPSSVLILNDRLKINECFFYLKHIYNNQLKSGSGSGGGNEKQSQNQQQQQPPQLKMVPQANPQQEEEIKRLKVLLQQRDNEIMILLNMIEKEKQKGNNEVVENPKQSDKEMMQSMVNVSQPVQFPNYEQEISRASQIQIEEQKNSKVFQGGLDGKPRVQRAAPMQVSQQTTEVDSMLYQPLQLTNEQLLDRNQSFEMFRKSYRKNQAMEENKEILKEKFQRGKELGQVVNQSRVMINNIKNKIEQLRKDKVVQGLHGDTTEIDRAEEKLTAEIENHKAVYKDSFDELKILKGEIERIQHLLEKNREKMQSDFEKWLDVMLQQRNLSMASSKVKDKDVEKKLEQFYKNKEIINKI